MANAVLTGNETLQVLAIAANGSPAATTQTTTTAAIAALGASENPYLITTTSNTTGTTLSAASLLGDQIVRQGPTAAFTDTTDTAANIIAAFPGGITTGSNTVVYKNATAFPATIAAGTGVTLPITVVVPPFESAIYAVVPTGAGAVTFYHEGTNALSTGQNIASPAATSLSTVGAGTITAAGFASGLTTRGGAQSATAFTDTTDTATNIIGALVQLMGKIGAGTNYTYQNLTNAPATITGGTGVTVSGFTVAPANSTVTYLLTYTATNTITMVGVSVVLNPTFGTFTNNGVTPVTVTNSAVSPSSIIVPTLKTVGGTVGASAPTVKTITPGTGFTIAGLASDTSVYNYMIVG